MGEGGRAEASHTPPDGPSRRAGGPGAVHLPTGAWYDPVDPYEDAPLCVHGNPNVLTRDVGTSCLARGCTGQLTAVQVERFTGNLPPIRAYEPPEAADRLPAE